MTVWQGSALLGVQGGINVVNPDLKYWTFELTADTTLFTADGTWLTADQTYEVYQKLGTRTAGTGNLLASARVVVSASALFSGRGDLDASARQLMRASALFAGDGDLNASAFKRTPAIALLGGRGDLDIDVKLRFLAARALLAGAGD